MKEPLVRVGIVSGHRIDFELVGGFRLLENNATYTGKLSLQFLNGKVLLPDGGASFMSLTFEPLDENARFVLFDVTIGLDFHWQRDEDQRFQGTLQIIADNGRITAVDVIPIEDYLRSVISSEMRATSSPALLKAHAVISRSWLLAQLDRRQKSAGKHPTTLATEGERIRWYDREDHLLYDVCADDHCQRYQGMARADNLRVHEAVQATRGMVLCYRGEICDTRFSKCCGGISEKFENVWEPVAHPYLTSILDSDRVPDGYDLNLKNEQAAEKWIISRPCAFCNTDDRNVLAQILNDYDQTTRNFYRWQVAYTQEEIRHIVRLKTGCDFGDIVDIKPVERGDSGRAIRLKIVGTKEVLTIGKELEIRKALSHAHLYSSAFVVRKEGVDIPRRFILLGAGWGHGVGLCQIGAAVMGEKGYAFEAILAHYFKGATIETRY